MNKYTSETELAPARPRSDAYDEIDFGKILRIVARNWSILALGAIVGIALGIASVATTTRLYTAQIDINISRSSDIETFQDFSGVMASRGSEIQVETEIQVLQSEQIARRVVQELNLQDNREFLNPPQNGINRIIGPIRRQLGKLVLVARNTMSEPIPELVVDEIDEESAAIERATRMLRSNMGVSSVRGSRVLQVRYTSTSPSLSARIANAIGQAYIKDQLDATDEASQRAINWLRDRTDQLRSQSERLTEIAEEFRSENNLLAVDIDSLADAEYERLTRNLVDARASLVELEALSRRLDEIVATNDTSAVVRETAMQGITAGLRARYLDVLRSYNSLASTLGDDHAQTLRRQRELEEIEGLMFEEIRRSAELTRSDVVSARERVASLEIAQQTVSQRVGADVAIFNRLRELERNAETVRNLYTSYLQRYQEALQRQEIPTSFARVLNRAQPPSIPSSPNTQRVVAVSTLLGLLLAVAYITFREWRDDKVRSEQQVREELGLEYLGGLTILKGRADVVPKRELDALDPRRREVLLPPIFTFSVEKPLSNFAETLRTGKMSVTLRHGQSGRAPKIGIVSCFPMEGKTTISANFANLLAQQGARVILIDGDMRNPGLTRGLGLEFEKGLVDILLGESDWRDIVHKVSHTGLHIIPNSKARAAHTSELMGSNNMARLLADLETHYDYVFVDLPPLGAVVDARAILDKLDGVFFALKWGGTNLEMAKKILRIDPRLNSKCYGAFMNMFDPRKAQAYGGYEGYSYYRSYYRRYYSSG